MGTGVLLDGAGADRYEHVWYAAGAAAHFGVGAMLDAGDASDRYGGPLAEHMTLGAGHHFGLGLFLEEGGDDRYLIPTLAAGVGSCAGLGLFVDHTGDDTYEAPHGAALGVTAPGTCAGARWGRAIDEDPTEKPLGWDRD